MLGETRRIYRSLTSRSADHQELVQRIFISPGRILRTLQSVSILFVVRILLAAGRQQEQDPGDDGQHVADDGHPVAPAEVRGRVALAGGEERLTEVLRELFRVRDGVVGSARRPAAEHSHGCRLDQHCNDEQQCCGLFIA